ncbi:unnamed protein product [Owenia fusiformis]|uniref:Uncharacterized protein n=1 Tax=Owenia fusiformis TaxID=6347 RepID=A0A8J1XFJ5_OWEFU|nr:unnamed protein product [Owenia fusiformis]
MAEGGRPPPGVGGNQGRCQPHKSVRHNLPVMPSMSQNPKIAQSKASVKQYPPHLDLIAKQQDSQNKTDGSSIAPCAPVSIPVPTTPKASELPNLVTGDLSEKLAEKKSSPTSIKIKIKRSVKEGQEQLTSSVSVSDGEVHHKSKKKHKKQKKSHSKEKEPVVMTQIVSGKQPEVGANDKPIKWLVGDLVWSKVSGHPWWPCMISFDPIDGISTKMAGGALKKRMYHTQFFGSAAERGWVSEAATLEFKGKEAFDKDVAQQISEAKSKKQKASAIERFKTKCSGQRQLALDLAIKEANDALKLSIDERKQKLTFVYQIPQPKPTSSKTDSSKADSTKSSKKRKADDIDSENESLSEPVSKRQKTTKTPSTTPKSKSRPQKNQGQFSVYCNKHRDDVRKEHPEYDEEMIEGCLTLQWNSMTGKQRARYKSKLHSSDAETSSPGKRNRKPNPKLLDGGDFDTDESSEDEEVVFKPKKRKPVKKEQSIKKEEVDCKEPITHQTSADDLADIISSVASGAGKITMKQSEGTSEEDAAPNIKKAPRRKKSIVDDTASETGSEAGGAPKLVRPEACNMELEIFSLSAAGPTKKENVCLICEEPGEVVQCTGPCNGTYHSDCLGLKAVQSTDFKCDECISGTHKCFVCKERTGSTRRCTTANCGKFYHDACLAKFPLTRQEGKVLHCPLHTCLTCANDSHSKAKATKGRFMRCVRCPVAYHVGDYCMAAGCVSLGGYNMVCSRHFKPVKSLSHHSHINVAWCFLCSEGGTLLCCESCPASFHAECLEIPFPEESWFCSSCAAGQRPLYGDIVWVKLGSYRWWPGQICHPKNVPNNIQEKPHQVGEFPIKFFGSHDYFWTHQARVFLYQEGDKGSSDTANGKRLAKVFQKAVNEASAAYKIWKVAKDHKEQKEIEANDKKPAPFKYIKTNLPLGNVQIYRPNPQLLSTCECLPNDENPCGSDEKCHNRMVMYECHPSTCPAKEACQNQRFQKRQYPDSTPFRCPGRGWGLKTNVDIKKGEFVNEYVGELISEEECQRRIKQAHDDNICNFYMMTLDSRRVIDAGPKGNMSRFMNHSCDPNCVTQKWTVLGDIRVGLFAKVDIPAGTELTFNYELESRGDEKTKCMCETKNCSGYIGLRPKSAAVLAIEQKKDSNKKRKRKRPKAVKKEHEDECFRCGYGGELVMCDRTKCPKAYHLKCLDLPSKPHGKWDCPWHHCDTCGKVAVKLCIECPNSFCKSHLEGNTYQFPENKLYCSDHDDIINEMLTKGHSVIKQESDVSSQVSSNDKTESELETDDSSSPDDVTNTDSNTIKSEISDSGLKSLELQNNSGVESDLALNNNRKKQTKKSTAISKTKTPKSAELKENGPPSKKMNSKSEKNTRVNGNQTPKCNGGTSDEDEFGLVIDC